MWVRFPPGAPINLNKPSMLTIYGIKNCNSVKKALNFLSNNNIEFEFHDYKKSGADQKLIEKFIKNFNFDQVLNKKGMTFRNLDEKDKKNCEKQELAIKLMCEKTSLIKRPIILGDKIKLIGFDEDEYKEKLL